MKKLLSLICALALTTGIGVSVVACGGDSEAKSTKINLNTIITNPKIGNVYVGQAEKPTEEIIKKLLKSKYSNLDVTKINVKIIDSTNATITSADLNVYTDDKVHINYKTIKSVNLNTVIANPKIGNVYVGQAEKPTEEIIKKLLKGKYSNLDVTKINVKIIDSANATITSADLNVYTDDKVHINYKTIKSVNLDTIITNPDLDTIYVGQVEKPTEEIIKKILKGKYSNLDVTKINVKIIDSAIATITSADLNVYTENELQVSYISNNFTEMKDIITGKVLSLATDSSGKVYAGTKTANNVGAVWSMASGATSFTIVKGTTGEVLSLAIDSNDKVYAGTKTANNVGAVWSMTTGATNFTIVQGITDEVRNLIIDSNDKVYAGTKTADSSIRCEVWSMATDADKFTNPIIFNYEVTSLAIDSNDKVYVGAKVKDNVGAVWSLDTRWMVHAITGEVTSLAIDSNDKVYAGTKTANNVGAVWSMATGTGATSFTIVQDTTGEVRSLAIDKTNNKVYAGTKTANNVGAVWSMATDADKFTKLQGITNEILSLVINKKDGIIYAWAKITYTTGIFYKSEKL